MLLNSDFDVQQTHLWLSEVGLLNKGSCLVPASGVREFIKVITMILVTLCLMLKFDLDV